MYTPLTTFAGNVNPFGDYERMEVIQIPKVKTERARRVHPMTARYEEKFNALTDFFELKANRWMGTSEIAPALDWTTSVTWNFSQGA